MSYNIYNQRGRNGAMFFGRVLFVLIFFIAGIGKLVNWPVILQTVTEAGQPFPSFELFVATIIEIFGALAILLGYRTRLAAFILFIYLLLTTFIFHRYWQHVDAVTREVQMWQFWKNISMLGGLLYILAAGPGTWSLDGKNSSKNRL